MLIILKYYVTKFIRVRHTINILIYYVRNFTRVRLAVFPIHCRIVYSNGKLIIK